MPYTNKFILQRFWKVHLKPSLKAGLLVLVLTVGIDIAEHPSHFVARNILAGIAAALVVVWLYINLTWGLQEKTIAMEAYQADAHLRHHRVMSSLTIMSGTLESCHHGEELMNHQNCRASLNQQLRTIRAAMGSGIDVLTGKDVLHTREARSDNDERKESTN